MTMLDLKVNEYATKDLHFAAFLKVKGVNISSFEGKSPVHFIFDARTRCEELENIFWNGVGDEIMVNAKDYFTAVRDLRARVFSITKPEKVRVVAEGEN